MHIRDRLPVVLLIPALTAFALPATFLMGRGGARRRPLGHGKELRQYRDQLATNTASIDERLESAADTIDALRRRAVDPEEAVSLLQAEEDELDQRAESVEDMLAPEELHGLHMEYEANLERALRGIVTAERGCAITRLPHRPPDDEEPFNYWKRAHANIVNARMRMQEVVEVLLAWEPGKRAEVSVTTRLHRDTPAPPRSR
ncbi:MAG TPA: hypothetical protein VHU77_03700 [Candidatus Limnocylindria bacterium]|jgi:hypothetical protein|nr:hypothetical protein [Candidatus Limnocylindria bacterium]